MAYSVTRENLRRRLRDIVKYVATSGAGSDADLNRHLQYAVSGVWDRMLRTAQGFGRGSLSKTIAVAEPDGYVPGDFVPLPDDFRRLELLLVDGREPISSTPMEVETIAAQGSIAPVTGGLLYYLDGPGQDRTVDPPLVKEQRIRLYPPWAAGQVLSLGYVVQPPTLGDASDSGDDGITIDLVSDPVVRYTVARAAVDCVSREDQQGYQRAQQERVEAEDEMVRALSVRAGGPVSLRSYRHRSGLRSFP